MSLKDKTISRTKDESAKQEKAYSKSQQHVSAPATPLATRALPEIPATPPTPRKAGPHLPVEQWLKALDLWEQYGSVFSGFDGVEELLELTEADVKDMGVKNSAHRARIMTSLHALAFKYKSKSRPQHTNNYNNTVNGYNGRNQYVNQPHGINTYKYTSQGQPRFDMQNFIELSYFVSVFNYAHNGHN